MYNTLPGKLIYSRKPCSQGAWWTFNIYISMWIFFFLLWVKENWGLSLRMWYTTVREKGFWGKEQPNTNFKWMKPGTLFCINSAEYSFILEFAVPMSADLMTLQIWQLWKKTAFPSTMRLNLSWKSCGPLHPLKYLLLDRQFLSLAPPRKVC